METCTPNGVLGASNRDLFVHSDKRSSGIPYGVWIAAFEALSAILVGREICITEYRRTDGGVCRPVPPYDI